MTQTAGKSLLHAVLKSLSGRYLVYITQLISMMVLARIFSPEQMGIFAVIQVFATFFLLFSEMGLAPAIINQERLDRRDRDGIFSFTLWVGLAIFLIFLLFSPLIASFYQRDIYLFLCLPVAVSVIFSALTIVPIASLQKDKRFITLGKCDGLAELFSLGAVVLASLWLDLLWALAIKPLVVAAVRFFLCWLASADTSNGRASFGRHLAAVKPLLGFSAYQLAFNILNYFSRNLDNMLVGKYLSMQNLGVYDQAYRIMRYPLLLFTFALTPAIQPVLTTLKEDKRKFEHLHHKFVIYLAMLGTVGGIAVYLFSPLIVDIILGQKWQDVVPVLQVLALSIPIQTVLSTSGGFYQAAGRTDLLFKCGVFSSITAVSAIIYGIWQGELLAICWALLISFSVNFFQCYYLMAKHIFPGGYVRFIARILPCIIANAGFIAYVSLNMG